MVFRGSQTRNCPGHNAIDPSIKLVRMIFGPLPPGIVDRGDQTERDIEKSSNETEPPGSLIWPRRREVQPSESRRKNVSVDAEPPAMKGFDFTAGTARAALTATHARQFGGF